MTTNVLFICPHAAGKSLLAATYFRAAAARRGLDVSIDLAGPDPDAVNMANVQASLEAQGFVIGWNPRLIDASDTDAADLIVSVGCPRSVIPGEHDVRMWEVPQLSDNFAGSVSAIHAHAEALAAELG